ncbi:MAG: VCBS repeat-containing protein [Ramlibacter sp.]|nr:VCBS repeat-containing protein [Ramlibacter sp.]
MNFATRLREVGLCLVVGAAFALGACIGPAGAQTTVAGSLSGAFSVSPGGAATYRLPIQVPPGIAGMEPKLELVYSSQGGNGVAGVGWSLSGLSSISRCPATLAQDGVLGGVNLNQLDRFCLDGQRLMVVGGVAYGSVGAQYRTELESFSRVESQGGTLANGPQSFTVRTKSGLTMEYAAIIPVSGKTVPMGWALSKVEDAKGNQMSVDYLDQVATTGDFLVYRIRYTGHKTGTPLPRSAVSLEYETRPDTTRGYVNGAPVRSSQRLKTIRAQLFDPNTGIYDTVSAYSLSYLPEGPTRLSRLASIVRCNSDQYGITECLSPLTFAWQDASSPVSQSLTVASAQTLTSENFDETWQIGAADVNGDGKTDLVAYRVKETEFCYRTWISLGNGQFDPKTPFCTTAFDHSHWVFQLGDVDGDGKTDLVGYFAESSGLCTEQWLSDGNGQFNRKDNLRGCHQLVSWEHWGFELVDVNRDGRADLLGTKNSGGSLCTAVLLATTANGGHFTLGAQGCKSGDYAEWKNFAGDVNGDGLPDIIAYRVEGIPTGCVEVQLGDGAGVFNLSPQSRTCNVQTFTTNSGTNGQLVPVPMVAGAGDFNGDGKLDLVFHRAMQSGGFCAQILISDGIDKFSPASASQCYGNYTGTSGSTAVAADVDGDGRTDLIPYNAYGTGAWPMLVRGDSNYLQTQYQAAISSMSSSRAIRLMVADLEGYGQPDLLAVAMDSSGIKVQRATSARNRSLIVGIQNVSPNGIDMSPPVSIEYTPATRGAYTKGVGATYPVADLAMPMMLVASASVANGVGGTNTVAYAYEGLRAELASGRGMLGFHSFQETHNSNNTTFYTEYAQEWPFTGAAVRAESRIPGRGNGGLIKRTDTTYSQTVGTEPVSIFTYPLSVVERAWDLNGASMPTSTTTHVYSQSPQYGDPIQITIQTSDGSSKVVDNVYKPAETSAGRWILGRLSRSTVTHHAGTGGSTGGGTGGSPGGARSCSLVVPLEPVPAGAEYTVTVVTNGLETNDVWWRGSVNNVPLTQPEFAGHLNVNSVTFFYRNELNQIGGVDQIYTRFAEIRGPELPGHPGVPNVLCTTAEAEITLLQPRPPVPSCDLTTDHVSVPFGESYTWTISGANLPADTIFTWQGTKNGADDLNGGEIASHGLGTYGYLNNYAYPTGTAAYYERRVVMTRPDGAPVCTTPTRFLQLQSPPTCQLAASTGSVPPGQQVVFTVSVPSGLGAPQLPAGAVTYWFGTKKDFYNPSIIVNDLPNGELAGAAPGSYTYVNDRAGLEGIYTRSAEVRSAQGVPLCTTNSVETAWFPAAPPTCSLSVSPAVTQPGGVFTYILEGQNIPSGAKAYWYGSKCSYAYGNCVDDEFGTEVPGGFPAYPAYTNSPGLAGFYSRRAEVRSSSGAVLCTTNSVNLTLQ